MKCLEPISDRNRPPMTRARFSQPSRSSSLPPGAAVIKTRRFGDGRAREAERIFRRAGKMDRARTRVSVKIDESYNPIHSPRRSSFTGRGARGLICQGNLQFSAK